MYPAVAKVEPAEDFTLTVAFDNGEEDVLDMKPYLGFGVCQRLSDYQSFKNVRIVFDTVEWECGVDPDPEFVYKKCKLAVQA